MHYARSPAAVVAGQLDKGVHCTMKRSNLLLLGAMVAGLATGPSVANADELTIKSLRPMDGVSLDVGSKRVVGYFVASSGACDLTLLMSEKMNGDDVPVGTPARLRQTLASNSSSRVETPDGPSLEFACEPGASGMTLRLLKQVAEYNKPAN